jgi:hypothetical protein
MPFSFEFWAGLIIGATSAPIIAIAWITRPAEGEEEAPEKDVKRPVEEAAKDLARSLGLHWLEMTETERQKMRNAAEEVVARFAAETSAT